MVFRHQHVRHLGVCVHPENPRDHRADAGTGNHLGQQALLPERLDHAKMEHAQGGASGQQQGRPAIAGEGVPEELQLVGEGKPGDRVVT